MQNTKKNNKKKQGFEIRNVVYTGEFGLNGGDIYMIYTNQGKTKLETSRYLTDAYVYQMCSTCTSIDDVQALAYHSPTIWKLFFQQVKMAWCMKRMS